MFLHHRPTKTVITGKSGSGKTTYFERVLLNGFRSYWQTIFLYDWQGEMAQRLNYPSIDRLDLIPETLKTGFVIYDPSREFEDDNESGLLCFAKTAFKLSTNSDEFPTYPRLFACDEMQQLLGNDYCPPEIKSIMQTGRRAGIDLVCVSQQINEMHNVFRSQTTERVTFQHEDTYVLSVMSKWGFDPEEVSRLDVGNYIYLNDRGEKVIGNLFKKTVDRSMPKEHSKDADRLEDTGEPDPDGSGSPVNSGEPDN